MYDNNIRCPQYNSFKSTLIRIMDGDDTKTNVEKMAKKIQKLYDTGKMSSSQYDDLMRYVQDLV